MRGGRGAAKLADWVMHVGLSLTENRFPAMEVEPPGVLRQPGCPQPAARVHKCVAKKARARWNQRGGNGMLLISHDPKEPNTERASPFYVCSFNKQPVKFPASCFSFPACNLQSAAAPLGHRLGHGLRVPAALVQCSCTQQAAGIAVLFRDTVSPRAGWAPWCRPPCTPTCPKECQAPS